MAKPCRSAGKGYDREALQPASGKRRSAYNHGMEKMTTAEATKIAARIPSGVELQGPVKHERNRAIDVARMVAAILILLLHASESYATAGGDLVLGRPAWTFVGNLTMWGRVPFFFFLSGYFATLSLAKLQSEESLFLKKRLKVLIPPYLFWNTVSFMLMWVAVTMGFNLIGNQRTDPAAAVMRITGFGLHPAGASLWFIRDLILCSMLAPLLKRMGVWILIPCLALTFIPDTPQSLFEQGVPRISSLGYFGLGMFLAYLPSGLMTQLFPKAGRALLLCALVGLAYAVWDFPRPGLAGVSIGALAIFLAGRFISETFPKTGEWLGANANASFVIFAANSPYLAAVKQLYIKYHFVDSLLLYFAVLTTLFFFLCIGFYAFVKRFIPRALVLISGGR